MKNQYFGDENDYIKYGLLRQLSCYGKVNTVVCWMLTQNDSRGGGRVAYLWKPDEWRAFDPPLFDCLHAAVCGRNERNVRVIEGSGLLRNTIFYSHPLTDSAGQRPRYFDGLLGFSGEERLVFFDPDNGLEVKSFPYGRKDSSKYLFLREVSQSFSVGHSLLVYQHFPHEKRDPYIERRARELMDATGSKMVYVFRAQHVAFFLVPQTHQIGQFAGIVSRVQTTNWGCLLDIRRYSVSGSRRGLQVHAPVQRHQGGFPAPPRTI